MTLKILCKYNFFHILLKDENIVSKIDINKDNINLICLK